MFARLYPALLVASFIFSISLSTSYAAKVYHWVDEKGQAHYSETPPRDITSKKMSIRPTGTGTAQSKTSVTSPGSKKESTKDTAKKEQKSQYTPEEKAQYCKQSQDLMQQMNGNMQRRFEQPDGSFRKLSESEIADYRTQALAGIENYCQ